MVKVRKILWLYVVASSLLGFGVAALGLEMSTTVLQEILSVEIGIAMAVIPYCLVRAISEFNGMNQK